MSVTWINDFLETTTPIIEMERNEDVRFQDLFSKYRQIKDKEVNFKLRNVFIEHLWEE